MAALNGNISLTSSNNPWDWLGDGIYFWEQDPQTASEYAIESAEGKQFNKKRIKTPFVIWATIELGKCLNLVEPESIALLRLAHDEFNRIYEEAGKEIPQNKDNNRSLD